MEQVALGVAAAVISLAFSLSTLDRWLLRRKPYELAWSIAFSFFGVAAGFLAIGAQVGWTEAIFRGFYLFGAIISVPFLGLGTVLLSKPALTKPASITACGFGVFSVGVMISTPFTNPLPVDELVQGSEVFQVLPRALAAVGSGVGAMVVLLGAATSVLKRRSKSNVIGNCFIVFGTLISGGSGMLNSIADAMTAFCITLVIGIGLIFIGFLIITGQKGRDGSHNSQLIDDFSITSTPLAGNLVDNSKT